MAASGACPGHRALAPGRIGRLPRSHQGAPPVSIYAVLIGRTPNCYGRAHSQAAPGALPVSMQATWLGTLPVHAAVFQLYAISGRVHFRPRPLQLRAIHRGWAHSQAFGGNVSTFNANATSQVSTRFAQLVWPHGYCWYPPKIKKIHLSWSIASLKVAYCAAYAVREGVIRRREEEERERERESKVRDHPTFMLRLRPGSPPVPRIVDSSCCAICHVGLRTGAIAAAAVAAAAAVPICRPRALGDC